ncbi:hypothetical protein [Teredinibacter sp. KSP-S5-2]|uniref:hypothetical protein n=1 Tax=Teredinibacter sp. KSP-S5-2 TaxID=3034506 RepID=UPI002934BCDF|nr:hypothetical protein [Teredinibacter sp. KSP-S5-2]WNO07765.1 hypothetical protein P5V12_12270 [Teredinibacter sp. KSP-S5-2]
MLKLVFFTLVSFFVVACANHRPPKPVSGELVTAIYPNGIKQFQFRLTGPDFDGRRPGARGQGDPRGEKGRGGPPPGGGMDGRRAPGKPKLNNNKQIEQLLNQAIAESQYCREGYILYKDGATSGRPVVRGECNEPATEQDRENFPNKGKTPGVVTIEDLDDL